MSSACANSSKMPDLSLVEAAAAAAASPTRSEAEEDEELNAAAAEAVRNLRSPKSDDEDEVAGENGRHSEQRCGDDDDVDRKGLKEEIDGDDDGENKEKQVSHSVSWQSIFFAKSSSLNDGVSSKSKFPYVAHVERWVE